MPTCRIDLVIDLVPNMQNLEDRQREMRERNARVSRQERKVQLPRRSAAEAVARLSGQLGYSSTAEETARRLLEVNGQSEHAVYITETDGVLVGWIHVFIEHSLLTDTPAEVAGLVIDENHRSQGVGRMLMDQVERWSRQHGCGTVRLRSDVVRSRARAFLRAAGLRGNQNAKGVLQKPRVVIRILLQSGRQQQIPEDSKRR